MQVIMGPVKAGDKVVVGGVEKMRPGMKVDPQPYQPPAPHLQVAPGASSEASPSPAPSPAPSPEATKTGAAAEAVVPTACLPTGPWHKGLYT